MYEDLGLAMKKPVRWERTPWIGHLTGILSNSPFLGWIMPFSFPSGMWSLRKGVHMVEWVSQKVVISFSKGLSLVSQKVLFLLKKDML